MRRLWITGMWMMYCFVAGSAGALADLPRTPERYSAPALTGWHEPRSCFKQGEFYEQDCLYYLNKLAQEHMIDKKYEHAVARFSQLLSIREYSHAFANRGAAYAHLERFQEARKDFLRSVAIAPGIDASWANLAQIDLRFGRFPLALTQISRAIDLRPNVVEYLLIRAEIYVALGKLRLAASDVRDAIVALKAQPSGTSGDSEQSERSVEVR